MLSSLVHEVAHHYDTIYRKGRGHWLHATREKFEHYAERHTYSSRLDHIIPYLHETYPQAVIELQDWIASHGGISLSLEAIASDPQCSGKGANVNDVETVFQELESLAFGVNKDEHLIDTRLSFAIGMHRNARFEESLQILDTILSEQPGNPDALRLKADILCRRDEFAEALLSIELAMRADRASLESWPILAFVCEKLQDWPRLETVATAGIELTRGNWTWSRLMYSRALARLELGNYYGAEADLFQLEKDDAENGCKIVEVFRERFMPE